MATPKLKCTRCGKRKPDDAFPRASRNVNRRGRMHWCRACNHQKYVENQERQKASNRRRWYERTYGLSPREHVEMLKAGCGACGSKERLRIDHRKTHLRGVLCNGCNIA